MLSPFIIHGRRCGSRGRKRARLRVKYTFDYRHKGLLSDPTRSRQSRPDVVARLLFGPKNVTPMRQFAVCVMSRLLGLANEYAVLGPCPRIHPTPPANEDHKMLHNPCKLCKLYPLPSTTTCLTSGNVTNLMCFASIKPQRTHGLGYPTIMWWMMGCAKLSLSRAKALPSAVTRYRNPKVRGLC